MNEFINTEELARLEALQKYKILDTDADPDFDNLVRLAVKILGL